VATEVGKQPWTDIDKVISSEERERLMQGAKTVLAEFKAGPGLADAFNALNGLGDYEKNAIAAYLAQSEGTKETAGTNWDALQQKEASVLQIRIGTLNEGKLMFGPALVTTLRKIVDIRICPTGSAIAYTAEGDKKDELQLLVVATDGSAPPQLVANNTACCSDWSVDGRSMLYARSLNDGASSDQICLGTLTRRAVLSAEDKIAIQTNAEDLAGFLFDANNKVRCLSDGRIIFAAADLHLPCTVADMPQQAQLFALDPEREATVIPLIPRGTQEDLPSKPDFYETSPDGKRIVISGEKGGVTVLTIATGAIDTVQAAGTNDTVSVPAWRSSSELCYIFSTNGQPAQVALWNNGTNQMLSAKWSPDIRNGFLDK
jgi:hypothetical protein